MQIWFRNLPVRTRVSPCQKKRTPIASIRAEGSNTPLNSPSRRNARSNAMRTTNSSTSFDASLPKCCTRIVVRVAGTEPSSLRIGIAQVIFDDVDKRKPVQQVPSPCSVKSEPGTVGNFEIPVTGMLSAGADFEKVRLPSREGQRHLGKQ